MYINKNELIVGLVCNRTLFPSSAIRVVLKLKFPRIYAYADNF